MTRPKASSDATPSVPPSVELAWGIRERPSKGPKRGLTLDLIVAAAVKVALTDGIGAVSMARVAADLGASTMSLYRYVSAKDELLMLMVDTALGPPPELSSAEWRSGLATWAAAERAAYRRHPWSLRVPINGPPLGPNNVAWLNAALQCLAETNLSEQEKLSSVLLITGFVRNEATLTADFSAASAGHDATLTYGAILRYLTTPEQFPALHRTLQSGSLDDEEGMGNEFDFGLERILDGIAVLMLSARASPDGPL
jgi:AcrR family transcriptional regulator